MYPYAAGGTGLAATLPLWVQEGGREKMLDMVAQGHLLRRSPSWISILHDAEHPSELSLPITDGNRIGTYLSTGTSAIS